MAGIAPVKYKKFEKFLFAVGCTYARTKGDHAIYRRSDLKRPVVVPKDAEVTVYNSEQFTHTGHEFQAIF